MILICGASGLVGTALRKVLDQHNVEYIATWNTRPINGVKLDLTDHGAVDNMMYCGTDKLCDRITQCIYLAAIKSVDQCENNWELAKKVNIDAPAHMASICDKYNIRFIFLSSDYVFSGTNPPYTPSDNPCPLQNYGMSKLLAELQVKDQVRNSVPVIIRTPTLYGPDHMLHESSITSGFKPLMNFTGGISCTYPTDSRTVRRPVYLPDLATFLYDVTTDKHVRGIIHYGNTEWGSTKYDMAVKCAEYLGLADCPDRPARLGRYHGLSLVKRPQDTLLHPKVFGQTRQFSDTFPALLDRFKLTLDKETLVLLDLDGTLIDSHEAHCNAYLKCLPDVSPDTIREHVAAGTMDRFLSNMTTNISGLKGRKLEALRDEPVRFMPGAQELLAYLGELGIAYCVVTNTSMETVTIFQKKLPLLKQVRNWITRADYTHPKPNPECYNLAICRHRGRHTRIIAIEDSPTGMQAIVSVITGAKMVTANPVIIIPVLFGAINADRTNTFKKTECYWFEDHSTFLKLATN